MTVPPVVLSIAGFDPSCGAGVTADVKTAAAHNCYAITCVTAMTVQSTRGVRQVAPQDPEVLRGVLSELASDLPPLAVHIGMLGSGAVAAVVLDYLHRYTPPNVVLDPILHSSSGTELLDAAGVAILRTQLLSLAGVVTPNLDEAAALSGQPIRDLQGMKEAAAKLHQLGARAVVVKGGHLRGSETVELLSVQKGSGVEQWEFPGPKLQTRATHGTGCAFATALACNLALGKALPDAVAAAKNYVSTAIARAYPLGAGAGPMNHLYRIDR
jgi:hydroxymethylpyrimidine/phosphomethylpyrimidine kinase